MYPGTCTPASFVISVLAASAVLVVDGVPAVSPSLSYKEPQGGAGAEYYHSMDPESGAYKFGYDTGSLEHQSFREETRTEGGEVRGSYGYVEAGVLRITEYTADHLGYRCRQIVRYLVEPGKGVFVRAGKPNLLATPSEPPKVPNSGFSNEWNSKITAREPYKVTRHRSLNDARRDGWDVHANGDPPNRPLAATAQPARFLGKKVAGHYKDLTSEPAVGGTGAVTSWNSAHNAELSDEEVFGTGQQGWQQLPTMGGKSVWPVTEDGLRVVWQPF